MVESMDKFVRFKNRGKWLVCSDCKSKDNILWFYNDRIICNRCKLLLAGG